jgi:hypothetical protein
VSAIRAASVLLLGLCALLITGCPVGPDPEPAEPEPCEDDPIQIDAACEDDLWEPNEVLADAVDYFALETAGEEAVACPGEVDVWYVDPDGDSAQLIVEWADCEVTLVVRAFDYQGNELPDLERGNLDTDRRQSLVFRDGLNGYVEVSNPLPEQGPVHYTLDSVLWDDED